MGPLLTTLNLAGTHDDEGLASIIFVASGGYGGAQAPFGGTKPRLSTNPIAMGFPFQPEGPFLADFATTAVAEPLEDPPGLTDESWGAQAFSVVVSPSGVVARLVARGPIWVFPSRIAPPSLSRDQVVASQSGQHDLPAPIAGPRIESRLVRLGPHQPAKLCRAHLGEVSASEGPKLIGQPKPSGRLPAWPTGMSRSLRR